MEKYRAWRGILLSDVGILVLFALAKLVFHILTNGQYGFHRDELATVDDARYLAWGYVAYPPLTPFVARMAFVLFGPSLTGLRFFGALAQSIAIVLAGLMARELGGGRWAQIVAAVAVAIAPISLAESTLFQYVGLDYLWWVLIAYLTIRLLKSEDPRGWLAIGVVIGLGMLTRYTMAFYVAGIVVGVLLTPARRYLASPWLWGGVALSLVILLPNLIWQVQHNFVSLEFLSSIHTRDVRIGRTEDFWIDQLRLAANPFTIPLWVAGLYFYLFAPAGRRYRMLGWMAVVPFALFYISQGRGYYVGPIYPMLLAAGAVSVEHWVSLLSRGRARLIEGVTFAMLVLGAAILLLLGPYAPINSGLWDVASQINTDLKEEVGWPELVQTVADIYTALPTEERAQAGILAGNYGEAGAINLYGPGYRLPEAISGIDSYWYRGYGNPPPQTVVVIGFNRTRVNGIFESCELAGHVANAYGVSNEETRDHPDIFVCRRPREPWSEFWKDLQSFG
jgi:4-amino-4-deoxy-L-arabinose transferase-like glycosyltransferase